MGVVSLFLLKVCWLCMYSHKKIILFNVLGGSSNNSGQRVAILAAM